MRAQSVTIVALALAGGCGDPPTLAADAGDSPDAQLLDAQRPDAKLPDAAQVPDAVPPEPCAPGKVCLDVVPTIPGQPIPDGRLIVVFYDYTEFFDLPLFVAYDAPFSGASTSVEIDLAAISPPAPPALDRYQLCTRTCFDPEDPACDCVASEPKVAVAFVLAMRDADGDGSIGPTELEGYPPIFAGGFMHIALSEDAYPPNPPGGMFPEGTQAGVAAYRIIPGSPDPLDLDFDTLGLPAAGARFALNACVYVFLEECQNMPWPDLK